MTSRERENIHLLMNSVIGLALWRTGDVELPRTAEDDFMRLRAFLLVIEAMLYPKESEGDG